MGRAGEVPEGTTDSTRTEAPTTWKSYMMCVFAAFGGVFFGYDSGYISGVLAMPYFIHRQTGLPFPAAGDVAANNAFVVCIFYISIYIYQWPCITEFKLPCILYTR